MGLSGPPSDHYEALGLGPGATQDEIERAFRFLEGLYAEGALATYSLLEPDEASEARARVRAAYEALADPVRRQAYDAERRHPASPGTAPGPDDVAGVAAATPVVDDAPQAIPPALPVPAGPGADALPEPPVPRPAPAAPAHPLHVASHAHPRDRAVPLLLPEPVTGPTLRRFREERGVTLAEISTRTKIGVRFLEYLEADRHSDLPALVYLKGFLAEYARCLGLDVKRTVDSYLSRVRP